MDLIDDMRKQYAAYWAPTGVDDQDNTTFATVVELRVRWDEVQAEYTDQAGNKRMSKAVVYLPQAVELNGVLKKLGDTPGLLGTLTDATHPFKNTNAWQVQQYSETVTIDNDDTLRVAML